MTGRFEPGLELVFTIDVNIDDPVHVGRGTGEVLSFTPIRGGTVQGPRLHGKVLPGGGDWGVDRSGTSRLEARYLLQADDGATIDILNRGYFRTAPDVASRLQRGDHVDVSLNGTRRYSAPWSLTRFPGRFLCVDHAAISAAV
ncbi:DUF3237 domain-containing protein [Microbacterium sp. LWH7-1.2]|uniref:DUF3237 domain-containing protein n=1 Tax=Microbacterium sp. LWH7-1.2 TaxID=3135257 RepID=UPI0031396949